MAVYDLDRLEIFLVEDNYYIRQILDGLLRQFRVGKVTTAANGEAAIESLKTPYGPAMGGAVPDIIFSDLVMAPIDGLFLLRWVRMAKESPNRFIPFVMVSGAADGDNVYAARDLGVTEFLAKPFSGESIYKKLLEVIDYPRQFIASASYFGPDRRRKADTGIKEDQRVTDESTITVVKSASQVAKPKGAGDVWNFRLPNGLKKKAGGSDAGGVGEIPTALLAEAESQLQRAALDFTEWSLEYLATLSALCDDALGSDGPRGKYFEEINLLAHGLRGQGGTFGYPLITVFARMLYQVTGTGCHEDDNAVGIVKAHIDAMRAVIRDKIAGDGGDIGRALQQSLKAAIDKHAVVT